MNPLGDCRPVVCLVVVLVLAGCSSSTPPPPAEMPPSPQSGEPHPGLLIPALFREQAPEDFQVRFQTTKGEILVEVRRSSAPLGADRFYRLVRIGFFRDSCFFRAIPGFVAQFGVHGDPEIQRVWAEERFQDDPVTLSNLRGSLAFAQEGKNSRTTQLFFNLKDTPELDAANFAPIGKIVLGLEVADSLYSGYGELYPNGKGPRVGALAKLGNVYLKRQFPLLDYVLEAEMVQP